MPRVAPAPCRSSWRSRRASASGSIGLDACLSRAPMAAPHVDARAPDAVRTDGECITDLHISAGPTCTSVRAKVGGGIAFLAQFGDFFVGWRADQLDGHICIFSQGDSFMLLDTCGHVCKCAVLGGGVGMRARASNCRQKSTMSASLVPYALPMVMPAWLSSPCVRLRVPAHVPRLPSLPFVNCS